MEKKRIGVLEPDEPNRRGLTNDEGLALLDALLKSKTLKGDERSTIESLKTDLGAADLASGFVDFFSDFFENDKTTELVFKGLERHIAIRKKAEAAGKCADPVNKFLPELLSGELAKPGRSKDRKKIMQHILECRICRNACVQHAHREVTVPLLKELGIS